MVSEHKFVENPSARKDICWRCGEPRIFHVPQADSQTAQYLGERERKEEEVFVGGQNAFHVEPKDNWKHRSSSMRCRTCMFYVAKIVAAPVTEVVCRCRRHAPTIIGFPAVFPADWCGDHKIDECKI